MNPTVSSPSAVRTVRIIWGFSIVKIERIKENKIYFTEVDMLDGTPLLDIKPYSKYFDCRKNVVSGWMEKHFKHGVIPERTILK